MKTKYVFIHCEKEITTETAIYTVYIGTSAKDRAALQKLELLSSNPDFFFKPYSLDVCNYLQRVHESLSTKPWFVDDVPPRRTVTVSQLLCMVRESFFIPKPLSPGHAAFCAQVNNEFRFKINRHYGNKK